MFRKEIYKVADYNMKTDAKELCYINEIIL